ncbi:MAG: WXG100 family type VII secretion target [Clostridia bacterium]|nr:WXG100 family type VII secretion target [Clostridia bacterium]
MARIQVTPELLREKSNEVRNLKEENAAVIQKLTALVNGLTEIWQGEAQSAFQSKFESMRSTFTQFEQLLESYAADLSTNASIYEQAEAQAKQVSSN